MKHLDALIERYTSGIITREELEGLVLKESTIATEELVSPNSSEFLSVWVRTDKEYMDYVAEKLGG